jgi:hypothetical protein
MTWPPCGQPDSQDARGKNSSETEVVHRQELLQQVIGSDVRHELLVSECCVAGGSLASAGAAGNRGTLINTPSRTPCE